VVDDDRKRRWVSRVFEPINVFTLLLVVVGALQWCTLRSTDQTLKIQGRAWLAPRGFAQVPPNFTAHLSEYTEATLKIENVGKEPALQVVERIFPIALPTSDWNNKVSMIAAIQSSMPWHECRNMPLQPSGRVIWPGQTAGYVVGFSKEATSKINAGTHFAMLAGCIQYETLHERHWSEVCVILERVAQEDRWRADDCIVFNQAN
jgi:hypothetical protein